MLAALVVLLVGLGLYPQPVIDAARAPRTRVRRDLYSLEPGATRDGACPDRSHAVNEQMLALLPLLITTATVVVSMFVIAVRRSHRLTGGVTIVGTSLALLRLVPGWSLIETHSVAVTSLIHRRRHRAVCDGADADHHARRADRSVPPTSAATAAIARNCTCCSASARWAR